MVLLHHIFVIEWPNGDLETKTSTLVVHGDRHCLAMARSVGLPVGIAAELLASGGITLRGVISPMTPQIYKPLLKSLVNAGFVFLESSETVAAGK